MLLELKNLFLEDGGKKDLHYEMALSQVAFSGVRPFITPVSVTAQAENRAGAIHLKADVAFDFRCPCDRCAAETQRAYRFSFQHVLVNALNDEENDTFLLVENESIELDDLLREDILLELPTKFLCKPDCKGLCPQCGKNLNEGKCSCSARQVDPRLEILKKLID